MLTIPFTDCHFYFHLIIMLILIMCWLSSEWEAFDDLQCSLKIFWRNPISSRSHWFHFSLFEIYSIMLCFFYLFLCLKMYSIFSLILINVFVFGHSVMMFCSICLIKHCSNSFCTFLRKLQRPFHLVLFLAFKNV